MGRSHGIHAEPTTFGVKLAQAYAEFARGRERLVMARREVATCAISGAVGTFANIDPRVEEYVAAKMGLAPEPVSTQVIPRDRHAMYFAALAVVASSIERLATEIRHLQRTEVLEAEEYFAPGQKGSSAMPHKRNPVLTENLTGLARLVRSAVIPALENVALWHERDISHSSVERGIGPDATVHLDFALKRMTSVIDKLLVYPENMRRNLDRLGGLIHSQRVLLALTQKGMSREESYAAVQRNAMPVWRGEGNFLAFSRPTRKSPPCSHPPNSKASSIWATTPSMWTRSSAVSSGPTADCKQGQLNRLQRLRGRSRRRLAPSGRIGGGRVAGEPMAFRQDRVHLAGAPSAQARGVPLRSDARRLGRRFSTGRANQRA